MEKWKPIIGFLGYEVSDNGRVRSFRKSDRWHVGAIGTKPKVLTLHQDKTWGYWHLGIRLATGQRINCLVHRLAAEAFIGSCPAGMEVNHKDGDKSNNCIENLEYTTSSDNKKLAYASGLTVALRGENHPSATLTDKQVREIRELRSAGKLLTEIAGQYKIGFRKVSSIAKHNVYKYVV